tara:strand:+ start:118 stop:699 length:582 start_codon:yes stop_codon:yes gene_type:complete
MLNREKTITSIKNHKNIVEHNGINIQELPYVNKINLRLNPNNNDYMSSCAKILGSILPTKPNTYIQNEKLKIVWLGPDEWMIINDQKNELFIKLKKKLGDFEASVTDVSENRTIIRLSGKKIITLLSKFLVLDLEKNMGNCLSCVQTLFVKVPVILVRNDDDNQIPVFDIFTNRSHANYIYNLIVDGTKHLNI